MEEPTERPRRCECGDEITADEPGDRCIGCLAEANSNATLLDYILTHVDNNGDVH